MEIFQIWKVIRQRYRFIISITVVAILVTGLVSFFVLKPKYEATATLLVQSQKESNQQQMYSDLLANQQLVKTYSDIIKSHQIANDVLQSLPYQMTVDKLLSEVTVNSTNQSLVTDIVVTDQDPKRAVDIANAFAKTFHDNVNSIMKVDNVSILDQAKLDAHPSPVSPKPYLNMAVALILGLLVGVGIAILIDFMDNTVKNEEEIDQLLGLPVLGVVATIGGEDKRGSTKKSEKQVNLGGATREL